MGFLEDIQKRIGKTVTFIQEDIDRDIAQIKAFWESALGKLNDIFNRNPKYKKEYGTPQEFIMGEEFEEFALNLFPDEEYILLNRTHDFETNEMRYVEESKYYDFKLEHRQTGYRFAVECKYRSNLYQDKFNWAKEFQMKRYKDYKRDNQPNGYYVMMGLGGKPGYPNQIFLVPLLDIKYVGLFKSFLEKYRVTSYPIGCDGGRLVQ